jgi:SAM-dependent methyltransferase
MLGSWRTRPGPCIVGHRAGRACLDVGQGAVKNEWYETLFDERYLAFYEGQLAMAASEVEAEFIDRALALAGGARILDLGCGFGRHAVPLAARGYRLTGIDLSGPMLERAAALARQRGVALELVRRDMRDLAGLGPFDACVCLYTVIGYFDDGDNERVLRGIRDIVIPGGKFLLDLTNPLAMTGGWPMTAWRETSIGITREISRYDPMTARLEAERTIFHPDGRREQLPASTVRMYAPHEVAGMLKRAGFVTERVYGALSDKPFRWKRSTRQVWISVKPADGR